jgi:hypothetical protein
MPTWMRVSATLTALCLIPAATAQATITVANNNDSGPGSLRQAIVDAAPGETIVVPANTYTLTSAELAIAKSLRIAGHGAGDTILRAGGAFRVVNVSGAGNEVTISGVTIRDGAVESPGGVAKGGGVLVKEASVTLEHVVVTNNHVDVDGAAGKPGGIAGGGGIYSEGTLELVDSAVTANTASAVGGSGSSGGIAEGGGLDGSGPSSRLEGDTFAENNVDARGGQGPANAGQGGGIAEGGGAIVFAVGPVSASASTFFNNVVDASAGLGASGGIGEGGGLWMLSNEPPISLSNLTATANVVHALPNGIASGGGVEVGANKPGTVALTNATLSANTAEGGAGLSDGGDGDLGGSTTTVRNTLVSAGVASPGHENCSGTPTSLGHNLDSLDQCNFHAPGDLVGVDPLLGPFQDNGGPTQTFALLAGSPAIDAGDNTGCPSTDARGVKRPQGSACDIGAFELAPPSATTNQPTGIGTTVATLSGSATNPDVLAGSVFFQWGTSAAYGLQTSAQALPAGASGQQLSAALSKLAPGVVYHYRAVATSPDGTSFGADKTFMPSMICRGCPAPPPTLSGLAIHPSNVLPDAGRGASIARKKKRAHGATVSYLDSRSALTTFTVLSPHKGFRVGHSCQTKRPRRHKGTLRRCTRYVSIGGFTHIDLAGANRFHFTGRLHGKPLRVGRYRLQAVARNAGSRNSRALSVGFRIIR